MNVPRAPAHGRLLIATDKFLHFTESIGCPFVDALDPAGLLDLGGMLVSEYRQEIISDCHPLVFFNDCLCTWNKWDNGIFRSFLPRVTERVPLHTIMSQIRHIYTAHATGIIAEQQQIDV